MAINTAITGLRRKKDFMTSYEPAALPVVISDDAAEHADDERLLQLHDAISRLSFIDPAIHLQSQKQSAKIWCPSILSERIGEGDAGQ